VRDRTDRGDATVEAVIIVPIIVVLTLLVVQFVLVWHGRHVAQAAAQNAARSAAAYQAQPAAGQAAGNDYLAQVAPNLLPGRTSPSPETPPAPPPSSAQTC
jgi:Flp pilus assembly protein TadG